MAEFKNDDLLLVNRADESYKVPGEAFYATYLDAPEIGSLSLVESNPGVNPRFTDQSFVATTTMTEEGQPLSEKTYDAYVEGAILEPAQFIEPLESANILTSPIYSNGFDANTLNGPNAFDGNTATYAQGNTNSVSITCTFSPNLNGKLEVYINGSGNLTYSVVHKNGQEVFTDSFVGWKDLFVLEDISEILVQTNGNTPALLHALKLDGTVLIDGATETVLNFAAGTDMIALAAGDVVSQEPPEDVQPLWSDANNFTFTGSWQSASGANCFDGNLNSFGPPPTGANWTANGTTGTCTWAPDSAITDVYSLRIHTGPLQDDFFNSVEYTCNGNTTNIITGPGYSWVTIPLSGTVLSSITCTVTLIGPAVMRPSMMSAVEVNGIVLIDNMPYPGPTGTIGSIADTTVKLATKSGEWRDNEDVTGPAKQIQVDGTKKYLAFTSTGAVTGLLDAPQSPPYVTTDEDPVLTLTFPATFPSGFTPDEELGEGVTLTVDVTAENAVGSDGPVSDTVQPGFDIIQFVEPLESSTITYNPEYSASPSFRNVWGGALYNPKRAFDGDLTTVATSEYGTGFTNAIELMTFDGVPLANAEVTVYFNSQSNQVFDIYGSANAVAYSWAPNTGAGSYTFPKVDNLHKIRSYFKNQTQAAISWTMLEINGKKLIDNAANTDLVFANGTDMSTLEYSDVVTQPGGLSPIYSATTSPGISNPSNMFSAGAIDDKWCDIPNDGVKYTLTTSSIYFDRDARMIIRATGNTGPSPAVYFYLNGNEVLDVTSSTGAADHGISLDSINGVINTFEVKVMPEAVSYKIFGFYTDILPVSGLPDPSKQLVENSPLPDAQGTVGSIIGTEVELSTSKNIWRNGPDVTGPDKTPIVSLTTEELEAQKLKFLTYNNRKEVVCGEQASAARAALIATLVEAGYTEADINQAYSNLDN